MRKNKGLVQIGSPSPSATEPSPSLANEPANRQPAPGFAADVLWETAAYGPDIKLSQAVRVF